MAKQIADLLAEVDYDYELQQSELRGKARGYAYAKIEYVSVRTYLSKNRIRV